MVRTPVTLEYWYNYILDMVKIIILTLYFLINQLSTDLEYLLVSSSNIIQCQRMPAALCEAKKTSSAFPHGLSISATHIEKQTQTSSQCSLFFARSFNVQALNVQTLL